jgi:hypothetical protein
MEKIYKQNRVYSFKKIIKSLTHRFVWYFIRPCHNLFVFFNKIESFFSRVFLNRKSSIQTFKKKALKQYCRENNFEFFTLEEETLREVCVPKYFEKNDESIILSIKSPEIYSVTFFNVEIVAESSYILKDNFILYDMFDSLSGVRYDLRFGSILSLSKAGDVVIRFNSTERVQIEKGIFLVGFGSFNYYHFTVELMSKFNYINSNKRFSNYPIIVDEIVLEIPQFKELLISLNYSKRKIISLKKNTKYLVSELLYISEVSSMPINIRERSNLHEDFRISKNILEFLRNKVGNNKNNSNTIKPLKIFISRNTRFFQRLINQTEVSSLFESYGFKIVNTDELSFKEQVNIFSNANVVAGVSGAALTNIIYCRPGTTLVSIIPNEYNFNLYSTIAHHLGIHSIFLNADIVKKGAKSSSDLFQLDMKYCERFLIE